MDCDTCEMLLAKSMIGTIDPADAQLLAEHVRGCASCASRVAEFDELERDLSALGRVFERVEPDFVFDPATVGDFVGRSAHQSGSGRVIRITRAALAAAAVIACFVWLGEFAGPPPSTPDDSPGISAQAPLASGIPSSPSFPESIEPRLSPVRHTYRTAPIWIPSARAEVPTLFGSAHVPSFTTPSRSTARRSSMTMTKTPSLIKTKRRIFDDTELDKPQGLREHNKPVPDRELGVGRHTRRC